MIGLAEFVMRGRLQALAVSIGGAASLLFCWISAAAIALVTLRKGTAQGLGIFFWALLPAGSVWYVYGDPGPLLLLAATLTMAMVLRASVSLPLALLASVPVGLIAGCATLWLAPEQLEQLIGLFDGFLTRMEANLSQDGQAVVLPRPGATQIAGMLGAGTATMAVASLLLARYWQAALFNPGGFGDEFKALWYSAPVGAVLVALALMVASGGAAYRTWSVVFFVPLSLAGLALVHAWAEQRGKGAGWLGWFYVAWVLFDPLKLLLVGFALADGWMRFRQRWSQGHSE